MEFQETLKRDDKFLCIGFLTAMGLNLKLAVYALRWMS